MITKLKDGAKKSRTIRLALFEAIYGAMIGAAPTAFAAFTSAPVLGDNPTLPDLLVFYGCIVVGVSKVFLAGYRTLC